MQKQHHILTTGISLLTNFIKKESVSLEDALQQHPRIRKFLAEDPCAASAEINSLDKRTNFLAGGEFKPGVTLIYTETDKGKSVASLLEEFLKTNGIAPLHKIPVRGLDKPAGDATPGWAQQNVTEALTRLRESVITHLKRLRAQTPGLDIELNCTGGYKAEIAVLYELGRTLRVPVYYLHETFRTCVTLP